MMPYDAPPKLAVLPAILMTDEELLVAVIARGESAAAKESSSGLLILTGVLFLAAGGLQWGWESVVFFAVAIALHEIGHVLAMRVFGYKNVRMLFVPLFGGLATGEPRELDATRNALVALAGPVFGLLTTFLAGLLAIYLDRPVWLVHFCWIGLILNSFNLLPLVPLDGGQFTNDTLFSRYPILELVFRLVAIAGLGWVAFHWHAWVLGALVFFMLLTTQVAFRRACLIRDARRDPAWQARVLDVETVGRLRAMVTALFARLPPEKYQKNLAAHVHGFWLEIRKRFPGWGGTIALLAGYVCCLVAVGALLFFVVRFVGRPVT